MCRISSPTRNIWKLYSGWPGTSSGQFGARHHSVVEAVVFLEDTLKDRLQNMQIVAPLGFWLGRAGPAQRLTITVFAYTPLAFGETAVQGP